MKRLLAAVLMLLMFIAVAGCSEGSSQTSTPAPSGEVDPANTTIAICMGSINHPVHRIVQMAFMTKGAELGYNAEIAGLDEGSTQELITKFESVVTNGAKGCLIWTGDDAMYSMMRDLKDQCAFVVPHFAHDYQDTKDFISRNVSALAASYGKEAADFIVDRLEEKGVKSGSIGITQANANVTENAAADAFRSRIDELGVNYDVVNTVFEGLEVSAASTKVTGIIQSHPDIVAGFGTTGGSAQAWSTAMQNTEKSLVVVCMDYTEINQDLVLDGEISAIVAAPLYEEGQEGAASLDAILHGKDYTVSEDEWFLELDAPLAYDGGTGVNDINTYRPIVEEVIEYFSK